MNIIIKEDAFKGLVHLNGLKARAALDKDKKPVMGKSGKTRMFNLSTGAGVYLEEGQYDIKLDEEN